MSILLENSRYYHIYNRGNNKDVMFQNSSDYLYFINLYKVFISGIADTLSWCLMKNHFHFLVRIKDDGEIGFLNPANANSRNLTEKWKIYPHVFSSKNNAIRPKPAMQFKHLFSTYTLHCNGFYNRTGSVIEKKYERILVENDDYLTTLFLYINFNPVKHSICHHPEKYKWSSCQSLISGKNDGITNVAFMKQYFESSENFKFSLDNYLPTDLM
ncbi:hypothetical protein DSECCO2_626450 [anaerobic digester metagenome]